MGTCASIVRKKEEQRKNIYPLNTQHYQNTTDYQNINSKYYHSMHKYKSHIK